MNTTAGQQAATQPSDEESTRKKRKPTGGLECKLGLLIALGGLIGSRLGQLWIAFDVFAQFTLHFAVMALAFLVGLLMPRGKLLAAFLIMVVGVVGIGMWPHTAPQTPLSVAAPEGQRALRVATFNTLYVNDNAEAVQAELQRLDADIVTLLEMGPSKRKILEPLKAQYPHQAQCFRIDYCNLVILSKLPITESSAEVSWEGPPYLMARFGPEAGNLTVIAVHTIRFPHSRAQFRQVRALGPMVERLPGLKLLMGDFNATPFSRIIGTVESLSGLKRLSGLPTWPSQIKLPQIAIDHIFASPDIRLLAGTALGQPAGSDHFPLTAVIGVPLRP